MFYDNTITPSFTQLNRYVKSICDFLKDKPGGIAVRGVSGMVVGVLVAKRLKRTLYIVRKPNDSSHSQVMVEQIGAVPGEGAWVVDDFAVTGNTVREIYRALAEHTVPLLGAVAYQVKHDKPVTLDLKPDTTITVHGVNG